MRIYVIALLISAITSSNAATIPTNTTKGIQKTDIRDLYTNENNVVYRGENEIVKIYFPIFLLQKRNRDKGLFIVEAKRNVDGSRINQGLYIKMDNMPRKKILDNGRDVDGDGLGNVYFAASDGVYVYNADENNAVKYGNLGEGVISIAAENNTGVVYALSENHVLYSISMNGTKVDINDRIQGAQEIAIDISDDSLYYYDANYKIYVLTKTGDLKNIDGFPKNPSYFKMVKAPFLMEGMIFIVNDNVSLAFSNGTSTFMGDNRDVFKICKPSAYSLEGALMYYWSCDGKVYEYDIISIFAKTVLNKIADSISNMIQRWKDSFSSFQSLFNY